MDFGYRIEIVPDCEFRLDGGAMFGVVPRVLWQRAAPPDALNRIRLQTNCLFVETPTQRILVETGIGEKWSAKESEIYGIARRRPFAETLFERTGCRPAEITIVVNTHLHFDHAGGNTILESGQWSVVGGRKKTEDKSPESEVRSPESEDRKPKTKDQRAKTENQKPKTENRKPTAQFPNARYLVSRAEFEHAENPSERDRASYLSENWRPLAASGQLELMPDEYEVVPGLRLRQVRGHSATMQTVSLVHGGRTLYGFADLVPTRAHLAPAWLMSYDLFPLETLAAKKALLARAVREDWLCLFYHDADAPLCRLVEEDGKIRAVAVP